jgi:aminoglycoside phosphotransferase (APT) family kinase protein
MNHETIEVRPGEHFNPASIEQYIRTHVPAMGPEALEVRQFPTGASNLTYLLRIGAWEGVLRRPPHGPLPPKAHDMKRECAMLKRIHPVFTLAPRPYLYCDDPAVLDTPFYIMERRRGQVLNEAFPESVTPTPELCRRLSEAMIDTLVDIHALDWQTAGLGEFGHAPGFLQRQVTGWIERYNRSQTPASPSIDTLARWLVEHLPASPAPTLIHNDFKLNNILLADEDLARPVAVVDWEMATIGDPLFDLAITLSYWVEADDPYELRSLQPTVTYLPGFLTRAACMERYAASSGRDLSAMSFYQSFAFFKLAVIMQQIYLRWLRGQTSDPRFATFGQRIGMLIQHAHTFTTRRL